ncbi:hypothetical protein [Roseibium aggregatum]|uniref:hypothetical protein n=1 Tax=Roseibium aggregatum TaxID=187304 RepID=UPI003A97D276
MKQLVMTSLLAVASTPALAHPGEHDHLTGLESAGEHLLGSPFHQLMFVAAIGGLVLIFSLVRQARKQRNSKPPIARLENRIASGGTSPWRHHSPARVLLE